MVDNFYGSTQSRLKTNTADRRVEEHNGNIQQAKVYQTIANEMGDIETADRLSKLATLIVNKFGQNVVEQKVDDSVINSQPFDVKIFLKKAIVDGTLSTVWNAIKNVSNKDLSPVAKIIKTDIKSNTILKEEVNSLLENMVKNKADINKTIDSLVQLLAGSKENESALKELILKASGTIGKSSATKKKATKVEATKVATAEASTQANRKPRGHQVARRGVTPSVTTEMATQTTRPPRINPRRRVARRSRLSVTIPVSDYETAIETPI